MNLVNRIKKDIEVRKKTVNLKKDILGGVIVALVSIPIAMGYSQIAGLPVVYGLYASVFPILIFAILTSSPQFVVGVDAMPAVMVGSLMAAVGILPETEEAIQFVAVMSGLVALWFFLFYLLKAGRIVKYISAPVMGGFISGVGMTIIWMQIPKLFGGTPGTGELPALVLATIKELPKFNLVSFCLGLGTFLIILLCKKCIPKVPMTAIMLAVGAALQLLFHLDEYGVKMLPAVASGMPKPFLPDYSLVGTYSPDILIQSFSIALVIMAQTLLASGKYAMKYQDHLKPNRELIAYSCMNLASSFIGGCPINGSVSRSGIADALGCRSQVMSITAAGVMAAVLILGTPFLQYLPVPILTGIVMSALWGILDFEMEKRLRTTNRNEWFVFLVAFFGVLLFGTVGGVIIGVLLSFGEVAIRAVTPPVAFVGRIPGQGNFYALKRNRSARGIKGAVIYRFNGNLFFANIDRFQEDIEGAIREETHVVVVDARGIGTIDITAVDRLILIYQNLKKRGIEFYLTEHDGSLNDQLHRLGGEILFTEGVIRRTITLALRTAGIDKPYPLEEFNPEFISDGIQLENKKFSAGEGMESLERLCEFEWLYGSQSFVQLEKIAGNLAEQMATSGADVEKLEEKSLEGHGVLTDWGMIGLFDEDGFLDFLEIRLEEMVADGILSEELARNIEQRVEQRRQLGRERLKELNPDALKLLKEHKHLIEDYIKKKHPSEYEKLMDLQQELTVERHKESH